MIDDKNLSTIRRRTQAKNINSRKISHQPSTAYTNEKQCDSGESTMLTSLWKSDEIDAENVFGNFRKHGMVVASGRTESSQYIVQLFGAVTARGNSAYT